MPETQEFMQTVDSADLAAVETWSPQEQVIAGLVIGVCRTLDAYQGRRRRVARTDATVLSSGRALLTELTEAIDETLGSPYRRRKKK